MNMRNCRTAAILTIFLGLCALGLLNVSTALSADGVKIQDVSDDSRFSVASRPDTHVDVVEIQGISSIVAIEAQSSLTVRLPMKALRHFIITGSTTMIRLDGFWMLVENQQVQFEFQPGHVFAHVTIPDTGAQIIASPTVMTIDNASGEFSGGVDMRATTLFLPYAQARDSMAPWDSFTLIAQGIHLAGRFVTSVGDSKVGVRIRTLEDSQMLRGDIVIEPLLSSALIISPGQ